MNNRLTLIPNGPMSLEGRIDLLGADGAVLREESKIFLCRCGESANKPFCDGAHSGCGFEDDAAVGAAKAKDPAEAAERVQVQLLANGPLMLNGPVEIVDGAGEVRLSTGRAAICRCGASENRPFCDGKHKACGFEAGAEIG